MEFKHTPVLLDECLEELQINPNGIYVDGTLGGAGHSRYILSRLNKEGKLVGIDRDNDALAVAHHTLAQYDNKILYHGNHDDIKKIMEQLQIKSVDRHITRSRRILLSIR